jgi:GAF domain-containing protein
MGPVEASGLQVRSAAEIFAAVARDLAETDGVRPTLEQLVGFAVSLVPCHWGAAVVADHITSKPAPLSASSEPELLAVVAEIAGAAGTSPGWTAFEDRSVVLVSDLAAEDRFGSYPAEMVQRTPIRSVLSFGLVMQDHALGVMTLYSRCVDAFDDEAITRASVLADHATVAIEGTIREDRAHHLQRALGSNRLIGTATGILVERYKLTPPQAFDLLRSISQNSNRKLVDIAESLVATGEVPQYGRGPSKPAG